MIDPSVVVNIAVRAAQFPLLPGMGAVGEAFGKVIRAFLTGILSSFYKIMTVGLTPMLQIPNPANPNPQSVGDAGLIKSQTQGMWKQSASIGLMVFPMLIALGFMTMPWADRKKANPWKMAFRIATVILLIALSRPAMGFAIDLTNAVTDAIAPNAFVIAFNPKTQGYNVVNVGGDFAKIAVMMAGLPIMFLAVFFGILALSVRVFVVYYWYVSFPLWAVLWYWNWSAGKTIHKFASKHMRIGVLALLTGPVCAFVLRVGQLIQQGGVTAAKGSGPAQFWTAIVLMAFVPFLVLAAVVSGLKKAGKPIGAGQAYSMGQTAILVAAGAGAGAAAAGAGGMGAKLGAKASNLANQAGGGGGASASSASGSSSSGASSGSSGASGGSTDPSGDAHNHTATDNEAESSINDEIEGDEDVADAGETVSDTTEHDEEASIETDHDDTYEKDESWYTRAKDTVKGAVGSSGSQQATESSTETVGADDTLDTGITLDPNSSGASSTGSGTEIGSSEGEDIPPIFGSGGGRNTNENSPETTVGDNDDPVDEPDSAREQVEDEHNEPQGLGHLFGEDDDPVDEPDSGGEQVEDEHNEPQGLGHLFPEPGESDGAQLSDESKAGALRALYEHGEATTGDLETLTDMEATPADRSELVDITDGTAEFETKSGGTKQMDVMDEIESKAKKSDRAWTDVIADDTENVTQASYDDLDANIEDGEMSYAGHEEKVADELWGETADSTEPDDPLLKDTRVGDRDVDQEVLNDLWGKEEKIGSWEDDRIWDEKFPEHDTRFMSEEHMWPDNLTDDRPPLYAGATSTHTPALENYPDHDIEKPDYMGVVQAGTDAPSPITIPDGVSTNLEKESALDLSGIGEGELDPGSALETQHREDWNFGAPYPSERSRVDPMPEWEEEAANFSIDQPFEGDPTYERDLAESTSSGRLNREMLESKWNSAKRTGRMAGRAGKEGAPKAMKTMAIAGAYGMAESPIAVAAGTRMVDDETEGDGDEEDSSDDGSSGGRETAGGRGHKRFDLGGRQYKRSDSGGSGSSDSGGSGSSGSGGSGSSGSGGGSQSDTSDANSGEHRGDLTAVGSPNWQDIDENDTFDLKGRVAEVEETTFETDWGDSQKGTGQFARIETDDGQQYFTKSWQPEDGPSGPTLEAGKTVEIQGAERDDADIDYIPNEGAHAPAKDEYGEDGFRGNGTYPQVHLTPETDVNEIEKVGVAVGTREGTE